MSGPDERILGRDLRALRRDRIGFIFQAPYLIPFLTAMDNVALLPMLAGVPNAKARQRALEMLRALDVVHRAAAGVSELSGGEQQRISIARALANAPPIILADEPTAALDSQRALSVVAILQRLAREFHTAIIVVTHDEKIIRPSGASTTSVRAARWKRPAARAEGHAEYAEFAHELKLHAQTEEEVAYPSAILVGEYVKVLAARKPD